ncbi:hypothetical protein A3765_28365 [Oleiphilus sp. HI0130]|nr:hypothetical protein A3765_28675 [Oleiphilus sp. HI0130]KZZ72466.1 hypothetical protein A3765_28365 [Oleiphilus sp. HI0130]
MQELIQVKSNPALLTVNFDALKAHLQSELKKYDVVVTSDTVKEARALAAELNATKGEISTKRKEVLATASEPIKAFDAQMKELESMCADGRKTIIDQIEKFDAEMRKVALAAIHKERDLLWDTLRVETEFRLAQVDDLAIVSALTAKGKLTRGTINKIEERVNANKRVQDQTQMRLLKLENESYKAGLSAPLERTHVEAFLFDEEDAYKERLTALLSSEVKREEIAQQAMREKMEKEKPVAAAQETTSAKVTEMKPSLHVARAPSKEPAPDDQGKVELLVCCQFLVKTSPSVKNESIERSLRKAMERAGITSLCAVQVSRDANEIEAAKEGAEALAG